MLSEALGRNHSIAGGIQILTMLRALLLNFCQVMMPPSGRMVPSDPVRLIDTFLAFELAARAVSVHDLDSQDKAGGLDGYIAFDTDPLGFLLHMVDFLQEWDRPVVRYDLAVCPGDFLVMPFYGVVVHKARSREAKRLHACVEVAPLLTPEVIIEIRGGDRLSVCPQDLVTPATCKAAARKKILVGGQQLKELKCSRVGTAEQCAVGRSRPLETLSKKRGKDDTYGKILGDILQLN
jgi:hypothetical protein